MSTRRSRAVRLLLTCDLRDPLCPFRIFGTLSAYRTEIRTSTVERDAESGVVDLDIEIGLADSGKGHLQLLLNELMQLPNARLVGAMVDGDFMSFGTKK